MKGLRSLFGLSGAMRAIGFSDPVYMRHSLESSKLNDGLAVWSLSLYFTLVSYSKGVTYR
jgi:hypothetical protein